MDYEFRGNRKDNGELVYGDLIHTSKGEILILNGSLGDELSECMHEVIPETVSQYTGLSAKESYRGTKPDDLKIFNGDIILRVWTESSGATNRKKYRVTFEKGCFMLTVIDPPFRFPGFLLHGDYAEFSGHYWIIGEVYGNPDLLEREKYFSSRRG